MECGMAQRAPEGSMKQVSRPMISKQQTSTLKNDLHFGGLLRGMLRGYASGCASGVCFARAQPSTNTYLGPREKILTHIHIRIQSWISKVHDWSSRTISEANKLCNMSFVEPRSYFSSQRLWLSRIWQQTCVDLMSGLMWSPFAGW